MDYTVLRLEDVPDRRECYVHVLFTDSATGVSFPFSQWITGAAYDAYQSDPQSLCDIITAWAEPAKRQHFDGTSVTPRQVRLALMESGLLDAVDAFVSAQPRAVQIEWQYATHIARDWPPVLAAADALGLTTEQVDALFAHAATL